jgi:sulfotransferase family protein
LKNSIKRPIFIIGCPRSGTTLLRLILDSHSNICCGPETHFLNDMEKIVSNYWVLLKHFRFDEQYWYEKIRYFHESFQLDYASRRGKIRWADKTPSYTLKLDFINRLYPECQFVHIIRNGFDVVASYKSRWGYARAVLAACKYWQMYVNFARNFGEKMPPNRYFEIKYDNLVIETESSLRKLFEFLEEKWDPIVLDYARSEHDIHETHEIIADKRRKDGNEKNTIYENRVGKGKKELDIFLKTILYLTSKRLLKELAYGK